MVLNMICDQNKLEGEIQCGQFFFTGKVNLDSSKTLYEKGNYADSYMLYIESVEKIAKAFEIFWEEKPLSDDVLKEKIGHDVIKIYRRRLYKISMMLKSDKMFKELFDCMNDIFCIEKI